LAILVRLLRASLVSSGRGLERAARLCGSLAASTLRMRDLRSDSEHEWGRFYAHDPDIDRGLFRWEEHLVERFVRPGDRLLVVGAGTGRDVIALSAKGYKVCGIESAPDAASIAREACRTRGIEATIVCGYFEDVTLPGSFDVIMFSYLTYGYIPEASRRTDILRKATSALAPGGRIVISCVWNPERRPSRMFGLVKLGARLRGSDWQPEDGDVIDPMPTGPPRFHYEHIFIPGEVEREAAAAGLRVVYDDKSTSDYWLVVLSAEVS
jgi:SAM-dependent methyltransferase